MEQRTRHWTLIGGLLFGAVVIGVIFGGRALWNYAKSNAPVEPSVFVPSRWNEVRESPGHLDHLDEPNIQCDSCHGVENKTLIAPSAQLCPSCHVEVKDINHAASFVAQEATDCLSCHRFGDDWKIERHGCIRCHGDPQGERMAIELHAEARCTDCHNIHRAPTLEPKGCTSCHDGIDVSHGARDPDGATTCLDCHQVHDSRSAAPERCQTCHSQAPGTVPPSALSPAHPKCTTCHAPHRFDSASVVDCSTCHESVLVMAGSAPKRPGHESCSSCHVKHNVGKKAAQSQCLSCHRQHTSKHPADERQGACVGCHPIHQPNQVAENGARECSACHKESLDTSFHSDAIQCTACHVGHAFSKPTPDVALCETCHASQAAETRKGSGHNRCVECHEKAAHAPAMAPKACQTCHERQVQSSSLGHRNCLRCHETHSGKTVAGFACTACHKPQPSKLHRGAGFGRCEQCHSVHQKKQSAKHDSCASCHAPKALPGLHGIAEHRDCANCHDPHQDRPIRGTRKRCLDSCHAEQTKHEPTAPFCSGCHPFTAGARP